MIGILFGAGASHGSQEFQAPPLGGMLFEAIKDKNIGPRREVKHEPHECPALGINYFDPENTVITQSITLDEWVRSISPSSREYFWGGDFEKAMSLLVVEIEKRRQAKLTSKGASFMMPGDDQLDVALPEKIMRAVAEHLYRFIPSSDNLYRTIVRSMPEGGHLISLNYDSLLELVAAEERINLLEHKKVRKTYLSHPAKSFKYFQLHGGVTLCSTWNHHRMGVTQLISQSNVERINRRVYISEHLWFDLDIRSYANDLCHLSALSFYNAEKSNVIAPDIFSDFHREYARVVDHELAHLMVIGCRYTPHDRHLWEPISRFKGKLYWCGTLPSLENFEGEFVHIGKRFNESIGEIVRIIDNSQTKPGGLG